MGWLELGKTVVGIGAGTQTNAEHGWFSTGDSPGHLELIHDPRVGSAFQQEPMSDAQRVALERVALREMLELQLVDIHNSRVNYAHRPDSPHTVKGMRFLPAAVNYGLRQADLHQLNAPAVPRDKSIHHVSFEASLRNLR